MHKGMLVVFSGPSGAGKGTLLKELFKKNSNVRYSVSATTRSPRANEQEGKNYFFKTEEEFKKMILNDELVEWTHYCDNYYGTPGKYIEETLQTGFDVILEIEVEGAMNVKKKFPEAISLFILPPSFEELRRRIEGRGTETPEIIEKRMVNALKEVLLVEEYDYVVINGEIEKAVDDINSIIRAEKLKFKNNEVLYMSMIKEMVIKEP